MFYPIAGNFKDRLALVQNLTQFRGNSALVYETILPYHTETLYIAGYWQGGMFYPLAGNFKDRLALVQKRIQFRGNSTLVWDSSAISY